MVNQNTVSSDDLQAEEYEIISAEAIHCVTQNRVTGTLTITNKRIVFSEPSREDISFGLDEIELVKSNKHLFAAKDKLTIAGKKGENVFRLNYSEDWMSLIEQLLRDNSNEIE